MNGEERDVMIRDESCGRAFTRGIMFLLEECTPGTEHDGAWCYYVRDAG